MQIKIPLHCPDCQSRKIKKNGRKSYGKQNYFCKARGRQFIGDPALHNKGCHSGLTQKILLMPVRGIGIRDISEIEKISIKKVLSVPVNSRHLNQPKQPYYDCLEVDEFWTYVGKKSHKVWLIYAYHRESGEIVAFKAFNLAFFYINFGFLYGSILWRTPPKIFFIANVWIYKISA